MIELGYGGDLPLGSWPSRQKHQAISAEAAAAKVPWTSARCNRLLRPLSSKITLLRKEAQYDPRQDGASYTGFSSSHFGRAGDSDCRTHADDEAEWESSPRPRKKLKRTYSSKTKPLPSRNDVEKEVESRLSLSTRESVIGLPPQLSVLAETAEASTEDNDSDRYLKHLLSQSLRDLKMRPDLPKDLAISNWRLTDGICKGLMALLTATSIARPSPKTGCRSLFSTCLRQTPRYMAEEEAFSNAGYPDNDVDMTTVIYDELEEFGSMPGGGWEPLRELVRAHGIKMITDAIEEGLLGLLVARHLVYLCLDITAYDEAQCLAESLTYLAKPTGKPLSKYKKLPHDLHMMVNSLDIVASGSGRRGFLYRQTAAMLESGKLSIDSISSKPMIGTWNGVIGSIAQEDGDARSSATLLRTAVAKSYANGAATPLDVHDLRLHARTVSRRPMLRSTGPDQVIETLSGTNKSNEAIGSLILEEADNALCSTLSNILTVLSAIYRIQASVSPTTPNGSNIRIVTLLQELALQARQAIDLSLYEASPNYTVEVHAELLRLPLLAAVLVDISSSESCSSGLEPRTSSLAALASLPSSKGASSTAGSFLCAVAQCCGRARPDSAFDAIQAIVEDLITASNSSSCDKPTRTLCSDLALAAAFAYSEDTSQPNHLDWALQMELKLIGKTTGTPKPVTLSTPARGMTQCKSGYRWEEGICEWIAKTPELSLPQPSIVKETSTAEIIPIVRPIQKLPLLSELSPCAISKKPAKAADRLKGGEVKALHVLIQARASSCDNGSATEKLGSINVWQSPKKVSNLKRFQPIYEDGDWDELSTPDSSREKPTALSSLGEVPNSIPVVKRKREHDREQKTRASETFAFGSTAAHSLQPEKSGHDFDMADDELALLFRW